MSTVVTIKGHNVHLADPAAIKETIFVGRKNELDLCRAAWCVQRLPNKQYHLLKNGAQPLHFRLQGMPGVGKNELVYELARQLRMPLYVIQGHAELTPEDLALLLVPDAERSRNNSVPLVLRASPLATAIYQGGLCLFDEINRVSERALSPLASVLDRRQSLYSAMTGIVIEPKDEEARRTFRFCCALNPALSNTGSVLPEFIEQRTLPVIHLDFPPLDDLRQILHTSLNCSPEVLDAFSMWHETRSSEELSVRQAISMVSFALSQSKKSKWSADTLTDVEPLFLADGRRPPQRNTIQR